MTDPQRPPLDVPEATVTRGGGTPEERATGWLTDSAPTRKEAAAQMADPLHPLDPPQYKREDELVVAEPSPFETFRDLAAKWAIRTDHLLDEAHQTLTSPRGQRTPGGVEQARRELEHVEACASAARACAAVAELFAEQITVIDQDATALVSLRGDTEGLARMAAEVEQDAASLMRTNALNGG